jgi:hypothetical protein
VNRVLLIAVSFAVLGCKSHDQAPVPTRHEEHAAAKTDEDDDEDEASDRDNYWRAQIAIAGHGAVRTIVDAFDCMQNGSGSPTGECGPKLVRFNELRPPLMRAIAASGWRFDHWESTIREPDGTSHARTGPMPDGDVYINGFGYRDTGELETVTAIFVAQPHH